MIHFLIILNLLILPLLFWRFFAFAFAFIGILLWKLRWCLAVGFIGLVAILIPVWISIYQDNQQAEKQVRDYEATHPQLQTTTTLLNQEEQKSKMSKEGLQKQIAKLANSLSTEHPT
jgi:hypothetical protein